MAITYQPVMAPDPVSTREATPRSTHELVPVDLPPRGWTAVRILGLVATTAISVAITAAALAGTVLFALLNFTR